MNETPADPFSKGAPQQFAPPQYGPPPVPTRPHSPAAAPVLAFAGFAVLVAGLFVLPLNSYRFLDVGFVETRQAADLVSGGRATGIYSGLATFWWVWGAFVVGAALVVLIGLAIARVAPMVVGLLIAAVAVIGGVVHVLAMIQSVDFQGVQQFQRNDVRNFFDAPGAGVWVSIVGFVIVLAGGLVLVVTGRRR